MRELTVQVSESQFDVLVNFLKTLPYVKLPSIAAKNGLNNPAVETIAPLSIEDLGELEEGFDLDEIRENYGIDWDKFGEVQELFKDAPFDAMFASLD